MDPLVGRESWEPLNAAGPSLSDASAPTPPLGVRLFMGTSLLVSETNGHAARQFELIGVVRTG